MTAEEKRRAIATACGWKLSPLTNWSPHDGAYSTQNNQFEGVPNYLEDLNAMESAYFHLVSISKPFMSSPQPDKMFILHLMEICNPGEKLWDNGKFLGNHWHALKAVNATSDQRADAFLMALGLLK